MKCSKCQTLKKLLCMKIILLKTSKNNSGFNNNSVAKPRHQAVMRFARSMMSLSQ